MSRSRVLLPCLILVLVLFPFSAFAGSAFSDGMIEDDLKYEGFEISEGGFVTGFIINTSKTVRKAFKLDMWTTNPQETRIFWRKTITIGDMAPGARFAVKEAYKVEVENPGKTKFMFRIPQGANFRNK